jgi:hypothetical protein
LQVRDRGWRVVDAETILAGYRLLLDREPESEAVVAAKRQSSATADDLIADLVSSHEFMSRNREWLLALF